MFRKVLKYVCGKVMVALILCGTSGRRFFILAYAKRYPNAWNFGIFTFSLAWGQQCRVELYLFSTAVTSRTPFLHHQSVTSSPISLNNFSRQNSNSGRTSNLPASTPPPIPPKSSSSSSPQCTTPPPLPPIPPPTILPVPVPASETSPGFGPNPMSSPTLADEVDEDTILLLGTSPSSTSSDA